VGIIIIEIKKERKKIKLIATQRL